MANSISSFPSGLAAEGSGELRARTLGRVGAESSLDKLAPRKAAKVLSVALDPDLTAWLAAVGIREGETLTVLRRAVFGGPLHVRTSSGGEFALARSLARAIVVRAEP